MAEGRLRLGVIVIAMLCTVFAGRAVQLQVTDAAMYASQARERGLVKIDLPAVRGTITDRNGRPLAESVEGLVIGADPAVTWKNANEIAKILARRLNLDYTATLQRLREPNSRYEVLARRVPASKARRLVSWMYQHDLRGLYLDPDWFRNYPVRDVASNLVGFLADNGAEGGEGIEWVFHETLRGKDGKAAYEMGAGKRLPLGDNFEVPAKDGSDIALTIDADLQWYMQRVLRQTVESTNAESGATVVLDVRTGEVLGLADYPTFDANQPGEYEQGDLASRALRDVYEPGSVSKVLTMAALIEEGRVTPTTRITVPEFLTSNDRTIRDWFPHDKIKLTLAGVLAKSSNIGTVLAARNTDAETLHRYLADFGIGSPTRVGYKAEAPGILTDWEGWRQINFDNIAFGQGLAVNLLQMAAAVNTIANGGLYVQPSLIKGSAKTSDGTVVGTDVAQTRRVLSPDTAAAVTSMMEIVTQSERGTAPSAAIVGYNVAGKTGTAQRVGPECQCYDGTNTLSFAGFAPADDPRFLVYTAIHAGEGSGGGSVAGPVFHKIMTYLLTRYAVPPTGAPGSKLPIEW